MDYFQRHDEAEKAKNLSSLKSAQQIDHITLDIECRNQRRKVSDDCIAHVRRDVIIMKKKGALEPYRQQMTAKGSHSFDTDSDFIK